MGIEMDSVLVDTKMKQQLIEWASGGYIKTWNLLYRGSRDGFRAVDFHSRCDKANEPTLTIVKSTGGHIFGGIEGPQFCEFI